MDLSIKEAFSTIGPAMVTGAKHVADLLVKGENLSKDQLRGCYQGYVACKTFGADAVADENLPEITGDVITGLESFFADTLQEAGVTLPVIDPKIAA